MSRSCAVLLCLILAFTVREAKASDLEAPVNTWASQKGEIPIQKDQYGFYVEADYSYLSNSSAKMLLGLSNSDTLVSATYAYCQDFNAYDCSSYNCTEHRLIKSIYYPSFAAWALSATFEVYLDYQHWNLKTSGFISQYCTDWNTNTGGSRGGVIGLGTNSTSQSNFVGSKTFSFDFNKNLSSGTLLFGYNASLGPGSVVSFGTDLDWRTPFTNGFVQVGDYQTYFSGNMIFDIHAKAIGFPEKMFKSIMAALRNYKTISCSSDLACPTCKYSGDISALPNITLSIQGKSIEIPPVVYVKSPTNSSASNITLNLQALGTTFTKSNYVTNPFKDSVILDAQFMSYYYVVFDGNDATNKVKLYSRSPLPDQNLSMIVIVTAGALIAMVIIAFVCCFVFKKKKPAPSPSVQDSAIFSQEAHMTKSTLIHGDISIES